MPGAIEFLRSLKLLGHELYLISYCGLKTAKQIQENINNIIPNIFTNIYFVNRKDAKMHVLRHLHCDVMIDDTLTILVGIFQNANAKSDNARTVGTGFISKIKLIWFQGDPSFSDTSKTKLPIIITKTFDDILSQIQNTKPLCQQAFNEYYSSYTSTLGEYIILSQ
jgi:hypothetical protein